MEADQLFPQLLEAGKRALFDLLRSFDGRKAFIWDPDLTKHFNMVTTARELQANGVEKMFSLQQGHPPPTFDVEHLLFLTKPNIRNADSIAKCIKLSAKNDNRRCHVIFIPQSTVLCEKLLKDADLGDRLSSIKEVPIYFYSRDNDIISMESPEVIPELLIHENWSPLYSIMKAVNNLERVLGQAKNIYYKGEWSSTVNQMLLKRREQDSISEQKSVDGGDSVGSLLNARRRAPLIDAIILLDRWVDPVTPLLNQLTFEGLIDEIYGITAGTAHFPAAKFNQETSSSASTSQQQQQHQLESSIQSVDTKQFHLNGGDDVYAEVRDLNFNAVAPALAKRGRMIGELLEERNKPNMSIREYKEFVKRMPQLIAAKQSCYNYVSIAELIASVTKSDFFVEHIECEQEILHNVEPNKALPVIEKRMALGETMTKVLRLMCLQSLANDGLPEALLQQYCTEFLQCFGYDYASHLICLQKSGLLKVRSMHPRPIRISYNSLDVKGDASTSFINWKKYLKLLTDDVNDKIPVDISYVYSGYAPPLIRLCQLFSKSGGWEASIDSVKRLPGPTGLPMKTVESSNSIVSGRPSPISALSDDDRRVILVFFVGGVTYAEVSALRFLNSKDESLKFLIATTHFLNGDSMIESLRYKL